MWTNKIRFWTVWTEEIRFQTVWTNKIRFQTMWTKGIRFQTAWTNKIRFQTVWTKGILVSDRVEPRNPVWDREERQNYPGCPPFKKAYHTIPSRKKLSFNYLHGFHGKNGYHRISIYKNCMISIFFIDFFYRKTFKKSFFEKIKWAWFVFWLSLIKLAIFLWQKIIVIRFPLYENGIISTFSIKQIFLFKKFPKKHIGSSNEPKWDFWIIEIILIIKILHNILDKKWLSNDFYSGKMVWSTIFP